MPFSQRRASPPGRSRWQQETWFGIVRRHLSGDPCDDRRGVSRTPRPALNQREPKISVAATDRCRHLRARRFDAGAGGASRSPRAAHAPRAARRRPRRWLSKWNPYGHSTPSSSTRPRWKRARPARASAQRLGAAMFHGPRAAAAADRPAAAAAQVLRHMRGGLGIPEVPAAGLRVGWLSARPGLLCGA